MRTAGLTLARHKVVCTRALPPAVHARLDRFFEVSQAAFNWAGPHADTHAGFAGVSALLIDDSLRVDAALLAQLPLLRAVCSVGPAHRHLDLGTLTRAGVIATNTPELADHEAMQAAAENLIAAFGFGRLGGYPANLLNQDLACMSCCL
jgi:lactate dehydrogenase-like 2-hydroxyacid dehydrogenase